MGVISKLLGSDVDEFAKALAQELAKRYPPTLDNTPEKKISPTRITKVLEDAFNKAVAFKEDHKLGLFKKAKLGNSFRWELKELGYSEAFIEVATEGLIVYITRKNAPAATPKQD